MSSIDASSNSAGVSPSESSTSVPLGQALALWSLGWSIGGIVLGGAIYAIAPSDGGTGTVTLAVMATASWTCLIASLLVAGRLQGVGLRALVALRVRWIDLAGIPIGVATQVVLVPLVYIPLRAIWPESFDNSALEETARELVDAAGGWRTVLLVMVVVVGAPLVEEMVYRGLLQRSAAAKFGPLWGLIAASVFFGAIHLRPVELPGLTVAGLVFGFMLLKTGRLGSAIVTHAAFNATGVFALLLSA
ncbi:MAG: CPBP family intramembrane glutamic endopeptidase [Ilumatobacteraceae bacterium]|nr:CPBP family intramembrane metalloprotease [Actinomycetota bacterium]